MLVSALLVAVVAVLARAPHLFSHSTIPDEAFTFWLASHPVPALLHILRTGDFHPPLVYLLAHALLKLTAQAYLFRLVAVAAGIAGVVATYFLARRIVGDLAWLPALLTALCPILVNFDRFYRMYALLAALTAISWLCLVRAVEKPEAGWRWIVYFLTAAGLLYTHYLSFFVIAAHVLFVLVRTPRQWRFWAAIAAAVLCWLPWLPSFLTQFPAGGTAFNGVVSWHDRFVVPSYMLTDGLPDAIEWANWYIAALWLLVIASVIAAAMPGRRLALWLLLPVGLQVAYSLVSGKNLIGQRYFLNALFALSIAIGALIAMLWATRIRIAAVALGTALIGLMTAGTVDKLFVPAYMAVDWQQYATFLQSRVQPGDALVFNDVAPWFTINHSPVVRGRRVFFIFNSRSAREQAVMIARQPRVWLIDYQSQFSDPDHVIFKALRASHPQTRSWQSTEMGHQDTVVTTLFVAPGAATP